MYIKNHFLEHITIPKASEGLTFATGVGMGLMNKITEIEKAKGNKKFENKSVTQWCSQKYSRVQGFIMAEGGICPPQPKSCPPAKLVLTL